MRQIVLAVFLHVISARAFLPVGLPVWVLAKGFFAGISRAQSNLTPEPLSAWPYFKEIQAPRLSVPLLDFVLDAETLDKARADQSDLRLFDSAGREIPYLLRVRRDVATSNAIQAREFNRGVDHGLAQLSLDLGEQPQQHNQVEVETSGNNFRRLVDVQGSPDGAQWSTLASAAIVFRFAAGGRSAEQQAVDYPVSRYRYLRIRVSRDPQVDDAAPVLTAVRIRRSVQIKGETVSFAGHLEGRDADRVNARPASIWRVDLGARIPIQRITIMTGDGAFSRPFQLDAIDDPAAPVPLASGELTGRENPQGNQLAIEFGEQFARRLKLTVTDDRNAPLAISGVTAQSAARQVVLETAAAGSGPLRLYYGNPRALAPHYDLAARLPPELRLAPSRLMLGPQRENPIYRPQPEPFSERSPWLVYLVLGAATVVLAAILVNLARAAARGVPAG
jgi:hypothetical protein